MWWPTFSSRDWFCVHHPVSTQIRHAGPRMRWRNVPTGTAGLPCPENDAGLPILSHRLCLHTFCPPRVCAFISWQLGFGPCGRQPGFRHAEPERCPWLRWEQRECSPSHGWAKCVWVTERASSQGFSSQRWGSWIHLVLKGVFSSPIGRAHRNLIQHTGVYLDTLVDIE